MFSYGNEIIFTRRYSMWSVILFNLGNTLEAMNYDLLPLYQIVRTVNNFLLYTDITLNIFHFSSNLFFIAFAIFLRNQIIRATHCVLLKTIYWALKEKR